MSAPALDLDREAAVVTAGFLSRFRSHKAVSAGRIDRVTVAPEGNVDLEVEARSGKVNVPLSAAAVQRHMPVEGDWLMIYEDGYVSVSPQAAFVAGYSVARD